MTARLSERASVEFHQSREGVKQIAHRPATTECKYASHLVPAMHNSVSELKMHEATGATNTNNCTGLFSRICMRAAEVCDGVGASRRWREYWGMRVDVNWNETF